MTTLEAPPEDVPQAKRPGWLAPRHSLFAVRDTPPDGAEVVAAVEPARPKRAYHQPSRDLRLWVEDYALLRPTRTLQRWLDDNKKEGREPRDACDSIIPILREECDRVGEAGVPTSVCVMQPIFKSGRATWHDTQIRQAVDPPLPPLRGLQVSRRVWRWRDQAGCWTHVDKLRLRLMHHVTEYEVHPSCNVKMDETAAKLLGLRQRGWAKPKHDGRVRFIGTADKRNLTISTVIAEGTTKRVVRDLPEHENISYSFSVSHWGTDKPGTTTGTKFSVLQSIRILFFIRCGF